jgi:hypothetical protein
VPELEEAFGEAEFVHQFQHGGVEGVAAEVAVCFEERDGDPLARQKEC